MHEANALCLVITQPERERERAREREGGETAGADLDVIGSWKVFLNWLLGVLIGRSGSLQVFLLI
ncbi:hypothetical protein F7725_004932 [Dissostichus mawsoni]|uniref:Uncharacterized protein n=1 Tax=Dissostichus mawsoni TaxID=36200 RepID=A0A7J5XMU2_DISMA|nr:hypothetical protein F7725_004932 [Dissostichus mawsoni]